jgi:hypothetical protein
LQICCYKQKHAQCDKKNYFSKTCLHDGNLKALLLSRAQRDGLRKGDGADEGFGWVGDSVRLSRSELRGGRVVRQNGVTSERNLTSSARR